MVIKLLFKNWSGDENFCLGLAGFEPRLSGAENTEPNLLRYYNTHINREKLDFKNIFSILFRSKPSLFEFWSSIFDKPGLKYEILLDFQDYKFSAFKQKNKP